MTKVTCAGLMFIIGLFLVGCDNYPYKKDIQEIYDWNNQNGKSAVCMIVGRVPLSSYPYTIYYMDGEDMPFSNYPTRVAYYNRLENENLHYFSGLGFFTEEKVGEQDGKPLYRYDLTDLGRQYFDNFRNQTNFCFGRIVVDSIERTKDVVNGVGGGTERDVYIEYHVENIPDWVKNSDAYKRYRYSKKVTTGEQISGIHTYRVLGKNKLEPIVGVNGTYQWATRSDEIDE